MTTPDDHGTVRLLVPVGKDPVPAVSARSTPLAGRGSGLVIGLLDNHKHNSGHVLDRLQESLSRRYPHSRFVRARKPEAGKPAPPSIIDALAAECHAVVNGIAD